VPAVRNRSDARRRRAAAYHEAGHVVACIYVGAGARAVWINQTGGGYTHPTRGRWPGRGHRRMWTWLLVLFAGSYAQALACGRKVDRVLFTSGKLDLKEAEPAIAWLVSRGHVRTSHEVLRATHLATCMFMAERWTAIEQVAKALQRSGRLTGHQVRSLVKSAGYPDGSAVRGPLPMTRRRSTR
jgi:hypothetical protein